eukprot:UN04642
MMPQKQPMSWAALAQKNKEVNVTVLEKAQDKPQEEPITKTEATPWLGDVEDENPFFDIEEQWKKDPFEAFKHGVAVTFLLWSALQIIIQQELVHEADGMSDVFEFDTINFFIENRGKIQPEELADYFNHTISRQFFTILDDGSCLEVAKIICQLYDDCVRKQDFTGLHDLMEQAHKQRIENEAQLATRIACSDDDGDDDDDYWDEDGEEYLGDEDVEEGDEENATTTTTTTTTTAPTTTQEVAEEAGVTTTQQPTTADAPSEVKKEETTTCETTQQDQQDEDDGWAKVQSNPRARPLRAKKPKKGGMPSLYD